MYSILIIVLVLLTTSCASNIAERNRLDYRPAAIGPVLDEAALRYDIFNRSN